MTKAEEKKFFLIFLGLLVIVIALVYGPQLLKGKDSETKSETSVASSNEEGAVMNELIIEDLVVGEGQEVKSGDTISIHYHGTLTDGTVFDSSVERGVPFETTIGVGQLIAGWDQGIPGMKVGGKRRLTIPPELGYGDRAQGAIPANSTLIFEVELMGIVAP